MPFFPSTPFANLKWSVWKPLGKWWKSEWRLSGRLLLRVWLLHSGSCVVQLGLDRTQDANPDPNTPLLLTLQWCHSSRPAFNSCGMLIFCRKHHALLRFFTSCVFGVSGDSAAAAVILKRRNTFPQSDGCGDGICKPVHSSKHEQMWNFAWVWPENSFPCVRSSLSLTPAIF